MARFGTRWSAWKVALAAGAFATGVLGGSVLETTGFTDCGSSNDIKITALDIKYDADSKKLQFNVAGLSTKERKVNATLTVTAYGKEIYSNNFNPCSEATLVKELCPIPSGEFSASGTQDITQQYADMVPAIAFQVPDIDAEATLKLIDTSDTVACITSQVTNGKTVQLKAVTYAAVGVIGASLALSGASAASAAMYGVSGGGVPSPSFAETAGWFQGMAMNGMLSVSYPTVYRNFAKNFAFSAGIIPWADLQTSIDNFRAATGGNITVDSFKVLQNATLVYSDNSTSSTSSKRSLYARDDDTDITNVKLTVSGITAYAQQLSVPKSNTFMTALLVVAIIIAAIIVGILLIKVILEFWALFGSFPQSLTGFRAHYWGSIARTVTSLIMLLYGLWVLYCVFQFTNGDSWAAKTLAAISLAVFTGILAFFSWKIWSTAKKLEREEGSPSGLYQNKQLWTKYSLFYESYKKDYWWLFVPTIVYLFAKGCALAAGDGHGMGQTIAQLIIEAVMLALLVWSKPFERRSGTVIGISIQVVRVLSVICILVFVEQFGIEQTTKTVAGVVLIAVQSTLTGLLVILIIWNSVNLLFKENPHRKRRKEMEKSQREVDTLTPLDARNSLLLDRKHDGDNINMFPLSKEKDARRSYMQDQYSEAEEGHRTANLSSSPPNHRALTPMEQNDTRSSLIGSAAPMGYSNRPDSPEDASRYDHFASTKQSYGQAHGGGYRGF